jgi:hypothetical protein
LIDCEEAGGIGLAGAAPDMAVRKVAPILSPNGPAKRFPDLFQIRKILL